MQRRVCNPAFQGGGVTVGGCRYDACLDSEVSEADERGDREDDAQNETCDQSHLHSFPVQTRLWSGDQFGSLAARNLADNGFQITRIGYRLLAIGYWLLAIGHLLDPRAIWDDGIFLAHHYSVAHVKLLLILGGGLCIWGD